MAKKKKKIRVAFRKNRQARARRNDLTRQDIDARIDTSAFDAAERLGKGDLTRHRTVIGAEESDDGGLLREVDQSRTHVGRVLSAVGLTSLVQGIDGRQYECTVRRVVRTMARDERSVVVTGDEVLFQPESENRGVIERVNPRRGLVSRGSGGREHIIVANVDQILVTLSAADPPLKSNLIDRFLISAEKGKVRSIICINKIDLVDVKELQPLAGIYGQLGYEIVLASAAKGVGIDRIRALMRGKETAIAGQSGVGKSSLLNAVQPGLGLPTGGVSDWTKKGRHTTRRATLMPLEFGGWVADTPGIRQFGLWDVSPGEVEGFFIEFRPFVHLCRFPDCTHTHEEGCGVKDAVREGLISAMRYESYVRIVEEDFAAAS